MQGLVGLTGYFERTPRPVWVLAVHDVSMLLAVLLRMIAIALPPCSSLSLLRVGQGFKGNA